MTPFVRACLLGLYFIAPSVMAQRFEAESGALSGGATIQNSIFTSGGKYVAQNEGRITFNLTFPEEGFFNIYINAASPFGDKINFFSVNGNKLEFSLLQNSSFNSFKLVSNVRLRAGNHTVEVLKSWGYINIDFIEFEKVGAPVGMTINAALVTPDPIDVAARLYQFLRDHYGKRIISGVMTLNSMDETSWLKANTGKEPALLGLDFMHSGRGYTWYNDKQPILDAKTYYNRNGIPVICWHWRDPLRTTEEFYTNKTTFDVSKINDATSPEYQAMINDIDFISGLLKELQTENIPVIWRPLHEAAGGWFWWGAKGAGPCKKLYQVMFDRMVNHHGLKNLIWVWTREPNDDEWYPGDEYVDIVGRDIYNEGDHNSQVLEFSDMHVRYGGKKMVTLSETGSFPDPDNLVKDGAGWLWFMPWYGDFTRDSKYNSLALWNKTFAHPYVITLDEMPDLKTYEAGSHPITGVSDLPSSSVEVFPTRISTNVLLKSDQALGHILVYNAMGVIIMQKNIRDCEHTLDLSQFSQGIYFIKISNSPVTRVLKN